ncbi:hypothetical protein DICA2_F03972 [Diutina catenulata]
MRIALLPFVALLWAAFAAAVDNGFFTEGWPEAVREHGGNLFLHNDKEKLGGYLTVFYTTDIRYTQGSKELHIPLDFWYNDGPYAPNPFIKLTADSGFAIDRTQMPDKISIRSLDNSPFVAQVVQSDGKTDGDVTFHEPVVLENMKNSADRAYIHVYIAAAPPVEKTTSTTSTSTSSSSTTSTSTTPIVTPTVTGDITVSVDGGTLSYAGETVAVGSAPEVSHDGAKVTIRGDNEIFVVSGSDLSSSPDCSSFKVTGSDGKVLLLKLTRDQHPLWVLGSVEVRWRLDSCTPVSTASLTSVSSESSLPTGTVGDVVKVDVWGEITNAIPWESLEDIQYTVDVEIDPRCVVSSSSSSSSTSTSSDDTSTKTEKTTTKTRSTTSTLTLTGDGFTFSLPIPPPVGGVIPVIPVPIPICPPLCPFPDPTDEDKTITPTEATTTDENGHSITFVLSTSTSTEVQEIVTTTTDDNGGIHIITLKETGAGRSADEKDDASTHTSVGSGDVSEATAQGPSSNTMPNTDNGPVYGNTNTDTYGDSTLATESSSDSVVDDPSIFGSPTETGQDAYVETLTESSENQDTSRSEDSDTFFGTTLSLNTGQSPSNTGPFEPSDNAEDATGGHGSRELTDAVSPTTFVASVSLDGSFASKHASLSTSESNRYEPSGRLAGSSTSWTSVGGDHPSQSFTGLSTNSADEFGGVTKHSTTGWFDLSSESDAELSTLLDSTGHKSNATSESSVNPNTSSLGPDESNASTASSNAEEPPNATETAKQPSSRVSPEKDHGDLSKRAVQRMMGFQGQMPSNPLGYCGNNGHCEQFVRNHMVNGNNLWDNSPIPIMTERSGKQVPVFIVNRDGVAPGNACNTLRWFATMYPGGLPTVLGNGREYVTFNVTEPSEQQARKTIFGGKGCAYFGLVNHHIDEFPFNKINGDQYKFAISLMCVPAAENTSEGGKLGSFCAKEGSYTHFLPGNTGSGERPRDAALDTINCQQRADNVKKGVHPNTNLIKQDSNGESMVVLVNTNGLDCSQFNIVGSNLSS